MDKYIALEFYLIGYGLSLKEVNKTIEYIKKIRKEI